MTKISSRYTFFNKKIFPAIWFGLLAFLSLLSIFTGAAEKQPMLLIVPIFMAVFGFILMKKLVWDLADEVYDCGESLLIRSEGKEDKIALSNIMNLSTSTFMNPPRITLRLVTPSRFGNEISFSPITGFTLNPFARNRVTEDLIVRVDQARSQRAV